MQWLMSIQKKYAASLTPSLSKRRGARSMGAPCISKQKTYIHTNGFCHGPAGGRQVTQIDTDFNPLMKKKRFRGFLIPDSLTVLNRLISTKKAASAHLFYNKIIPLVKELRLAVRRHVLHRLAGWDAL